MTSYDEIEVVLRDFITEAKSNPKKEAEVLALRGRWGVGKTHLYKDVVKIYPKAKYISLFGVNSSEEMKLKLCFGDIESSLQKSAGKDIIKFFRGAGDAVATALALREVKETLICIDDIERKGEKLAIKDIMGFVDMFKQRNCHVVLILNDEKLQEKDERELQEFYEKTIDISPYLNPTSTEAIEKICHSNPHKLVIIDSCKKLELNNLRIAKKIVRHVNILEKYMQSCSNEAKNAVIQSMIFLTWMHEEKQKKDEGDKWSFEEYLTGKAASELPQYTYIWEENEEQKLKYDAAHKEFEKIEQKYQPVLKKYDFVWIEEHDAALLFLAKNGYEQPEAMKETIAKSQNAYNIQQQKAEWEKAFYAIKYEINPATEQERLTALYETTKAIIAYIPQGDLDSCICALRADDFQLQADELITAYITLHDFKSIDTTFFNRRKDDKLRAAIIEHNEKVENNHWDNLSLGEALQKMILEQFPNHYDRKYLQRFKADDYKAIFLAHQQDGLWRKMARFLLQLKGLNEPEDEIIIQEVENALDSMKKMSPLIKWVVQTIRA